MYNPNTQKPFYLGGNQTHQPNSTFLRDPPSKIVTTWNKLKLSVGQNRLTGAGACGGKMTVYGETSKESNGDCWINKRINRNDEMRNETMTEFKIVEIIARRFNNGREECQVQWAATWEVVDKAFAEQQLYKEFIEDLDEDEKAIGKLKELKFSENRLIT
jgi:hypothetical protein